MRTDQRSFGYGTILLKKLLGLVEDGDVEHRCEERAGDISRIGAGSALGVVNTSPVHNIIAVMAFDPVDAAEGNRLRDWYIKWGFVEKGRLEAVGRKMGHWYVRF
jgi:phosphinothricin acetyltransferase